MTVRLRNRASGLSSSLPLLGSSAGGATAGASSAPAWGRGPRAAVAGLGEGSSFIA
jgi:hypothetical protein